MYHISISMLVAWSIHSSCKAMHLAFIFNIKHCSYKNHLSLQLQAQIHSGPHLLNAPYIWKKINFLFKILIFHKLYPKFVLASIRLALFLFKQPNVKSWICPSFVLKTDCDNFLSKETFIVQKWLAYPFYFIVFNFDFIKEDINYKITSTCILYF